MDEVVVPSRFDHGDRRVQRACRLELDVVRPDAHVGWMAERPTLDALAAGVMRAVGLP